jgi:hypothetical protein
MVDELLFAACLESEQPLWLQDADVLVADTDALPEETTELAAILGLDEDTALRVIRQVHGKVDLAERARVGLLGEYALVALLMRRWPGCAHHLSLTDDGLGYDVLCELGPDLWHLEVKTTTRKGRLRIFVSRHEYETAAVDPHWRLIVVGLDGAEAVAVATVKDNVIPTLAPQDHGSTRWEVASYELGVGALHPGLEFAMKSLELNPKETDPLITAGSRDTAVGEFAWMPRSFRGIRRPSIERRTASRG